MSGGAAAAFEAASAGFNAISALRRGGQEKAYFDSQGRQLDADAAAATGMAEVNAATIRKGARLQRGAARAGAAKAGVQVDAGSAGAAQDTITRESELDALTELLSGSYRARRLQGQAQMSYTAGRLAQKDAQWQAVGSLLNSGARSADRYGWGKGGGSSGGGSSSGPYFGGS